MPKITLAALWKHWTDFWHRTVYMFHHRLLYVHKEKGGQGQQVLPRGHTESTGSCHWTGVYLWNHRKWPRSSNPFSAGVQHAAREQPGGQAVLQRKIANITALVLTTRMHLLIYKGEWQGNSPSGCCLLTVSPHGNCCCHEHPTKTDASFLPLIPHSQHCSSSTAPKRKSNHLTNFVAKLLALRCSLFTPHGEIIVFTVCAFGILFLFCPSIYIPWLVKFTAI